ncbi:hypothetical protein PVK06_047533 [Gossypium arboreum]|uniref:DUF4283 domain-containing protein n=1 Tax=Gossypium arboreum TaxID=29729 RepID=A0ABR0MFH9_GOSAR|nr:hypothetical protein PVK06_047533 [Gossypium arboreum]
MKSSETLEGEFGVARATKKVRWQEDDPQNVGDMEEDFDEDKFELVEGDVITRLVDGIPAIKFSERVYTWIQRSMAKTVIIKLLGWKIGFNNFVSKLNSMWKLNRSFQLMDLENDYYFIKFQAKEDYDKALINGPWMIYGYYLTVQPWSSSFNTSASYPKHLMVWIRLPGFRVLITKKSLGGGGKLDKSSDQGGQSNGK